MMAMSRQTFDTTTGGNVLYRCIVLIRQMVQTRIEPTMLFLLTRFIRCDTVVSTEAAVNSRHFDETIDASQS